MPLDDILQGNRAWAAGVVERDPGFFRRLEAQQAPRYLWIGCSDSRVPANEITGTDPGEVFVHRNVANVVVHTDLNCLSVLQYAIEVLGVEEIVVCGHLGCGGVLAALEGRRHGLIDNWLRHVQDVAHEHSGLLGAAAEADRADLLCRLNVIEQVTNVCRTTVVQEAWDRGARLHVHGVVYGLADGVLRDLGVTTARAGRGRRAPRAGGGEAVRGLVRSQPRLELSFSGSGRRGDGGSRPGAEAHGRRQSTCARSPRRAAARQHERQEDAEQRAQEQHHDHQRDQRDAGREEHESTLTFFEFLITNPITYSATTASTPMTP